MEEIYSRGSENDFLIAKVGRCRFPAAGVGPNNSNRYQQPSPSAAWSTEALPQPNVWDCSFFSSGACKPDGKRRFFLVCPKIASQDTIQITLMEFQPSWLYARAARANLARRYSWPWERSVTAALRLTIGGSDGIIHITIFEWRVAFRRLAFKILAKHWGAHTGDVGREWMRSEGHHVLNHQRNQVTIICCIPSPSRLMRKLIKQIGKLPKQLTQFSF